MERTTFYNRSISEPASRKEARFVQTIEAAKFQEQCLTLLDHLGPDGLVVTKHGKPVARVLPYDRRFESLIGSLRHKIEIREDIASTGLRWEADAEL